MTISSATLRKLASLRLDAEQMAGVLELLADGLEAEEARKADQNERKRRSRSGHVTVTGQSCDGSFPSSNGFPPDPLSLTTTLSPVGGEDARDSLGWPTVFTQWADRLVAETDCADPVRDIWPRTSATILVGWHETDRFEWRDVIAGIRIVVGRGAGPPSSWKYFAKAIARARADRTTKTPETQVNERRNSNFQTAAERSEGSTIAAFGRVFAIPPDGEDEPIHAAGGVQNLWQG